MKASRAREILNVTQQTLSNYVKQGKLHPMRTSKTNYEYDEDEVYSLIGKNRPQRVTVSYARVSLAKQRDDLARQQERLYDYAARNGYTLAEQISDVKSGMEFNNRKGFQRLLTLISEHKVSTVIIENRDRLVRFGFDLVERMFALEGTRIVVMSEVENKSYEQELTDDLISIIHYYSMKSYSNKRRLHAAEKALKTEEENNED